MMLSLTASLSAAAIQRESTAADWLREAARIARRVPWGGYCLLMDATLWWTAIGSGAGVLSVGLVAWQIRQELSGHRNPPKPDGDSGRSSEAKSGGLSVAIPFGRLPAEVRGRDALMVELRHSIERRPRYSPRAWVFAGMGGLGKSTIALAAAETARAKKWRVWWVNATDIGSVNGGILEVLRQLDAPESVLQPIREGTPTAADQFWEFLNGSHSAGRRWLLIFDNADTPAVLAAPGSLSPADYTGWLRPDPQGMVIVTTRIKDGREWGSGIELRELTPLDDASAAKMLADLAPGIPDPDGRQARELSRRLGGLPLALYLAGSYLASPFARWHSFGDYRSALDSVFLPEALADLDESAADARGTIQRTWDLSLDSLPSDSQPQARFLLLLLSCYAAGTPIPTQLLRPAILAGVLPSTDHLPKGPANREDACERVLRTGLRSLTIVGLINIAEHDASDAMVTVHPVVADVNRSRLLTTAHSDLNLVSKTAVQLLQAATSELNSERPADWAYWNQIVPHVAAVLGWLAEHLHSDALVTLIGCGDSAIMAAYLSGNLPAGEKLAHAAVAAAARLGNDHPATMTARFLLAQVTAGQGRYREAEEQQRQILSDQQRVLGEDHPETLRTIYLLAWTIGRLGRYSEAEQLYRRVIAIQERVLGEDHPETLWSQHGLARVMECQGRALEAERLCRQVLITRQRVLGAQHPDTLVITHRLARAIESQGRYEEAEQLYRELASTREKVLGKDHPESLGGLDRLAGVIGHQGRHRDAEERYRQVLAGRCQVLGDDHPDTLTTRHGLAVAIAGQHRYGEAEQLYRQVLADRERIIGKDHPGTLATRHALAWVIEQQGRQAQAQQLYREVLDRQRQVLGDDHPDTRQTRENIARLSAL